MITLSLKKITKNRTKPLLIMQIMLLIVQGILSFQFLDILSVDITDILRKGVIFGLLQACLFLCFRSASSAFTMVSIFVPAFAVAMIQLAKI